MDPVTHVDLVASLLSLIKIQFNYSSAAGGRALTQIPQQSKSDFLPFVSVIVPNFRTIICILIVNELI